MHVPIIALERPELSRVNWVEELDGEDRVLNASTDYYGDRYRAVEREAVIHSDWLSDLFAGIATVDVEGERLVFHDADTIRRTIDDYLLDKALELYHLAEKHRLGPYDFRNAGTEYKDNWALFYVDGEGMTSFQVIWNTAREWAGQSLAIGNIFDAHI